jgi:NitT/TauT family transport system substrate-binding protein
LVTIYETKFPIEKLSEIPNQEDSPVANASLSRRSLLRTGLGATGAALIAGGAAAQQRERLSCVISSATFEPGTAPLTSLADALGFWSSENLEVELRSARGSALGAQVVMTSQADVVHAGTSVGLMQPVARGARLQAFYHMITQNFQMPAVPDESPIRGLADLRGKRLGVIGQATATIPIVKAVIEDAGVDPNSVTFVDVGYGAQAAAALWVTRQVDGLAMYDSVYAVIENVNPDRYKLRVLRSPLSDRISFQTALVTRTELLRTRRDALIKLARGTAKATIFALENPEVSVRLHWRRYPEQKPTNISEQVAVRNESRAMMSRLENMRIDNMAVPRDKWGYMDRIDVETYLDMLKRIGEIDRAVQAQSLYTNDLIDEINNFDREAIKRMAREYRITG